MSEPAFTRNVIVRGFEAVSSELARREVCGRLFVVGGAAMALAYAARRVTRDLSQLSAGAPASLPNPVTSWRRPSANSFSSRPESTTEMSIISPSA